MNDQNSLIDIILENLGGPSNVKNYEYCSTRITFSLNNTENINIEELKNNKDIISLIEYDDDLILVLGPKTLSYVNELKNENINNEKESQGKENLGQKLLGVLAGVFGPALTILAATGMIKGFLALFVFLGWITENSGTYTILYAIGDCFLYFMPIFLGASAAQYFKCNQFLGIAIGACLVYPTITALSDQDAIYTIFEGSLFEFNVYTTFFNIPVILPIGGYVSTVIPIILAVACGAFVWKLWEKVIPDLVSGFLVPTLTLVIVVPLTFILVGPIALFLSNILEIIANFLYNLSPVIEGAFLAGFWQLMVMFGLHWAVVPIGVVNITNNGFDSFIQAMFPACFAQAAACLAVFMKSKDQKLKEICIPAFISGIFGITEPALYGVTLPRIKVFIGTCIASAIGGAIIGLTNVKAYMFGAMGIFGLTSYINPANGDISSVYGVLIASVVVFIISFIFSYFLYQKDPTIDQDEFN